VISPTTQFYPLLTLGIRELGCSLSPPLIALRFYWQANPGIVRRHSGVGADTERADGGEVIQVLHAAAHPWIIREESETSGSTAVRATRLRHSAQIDLAESPTKDLDGDH
jgi:hypothetical protein